MTALTYNTMNQVTGITFGSGDSDTYSYDTNSGHMTGFSFNVNGQSEVATIGWNANGTVGTFRTTDPFNANNNGTCSFGYDDMVRVTSANCAPTSGPAYWSQVFSFDPFGNISKSGSSAFQPTYSTATNRISSLPGASISYDANGNLLNDGTYTYDWTAFGKASTVNGIAITYDAMGRPVEQNNAGTYTQIVYDTARRKTAMMNGQVLQKGFVGLPTGAVAVYQASGLAWYRHADMLGSSRLATTPTRTVAADRAYAPYGEAFNETGAQDRSFTGKDEDTALGIYDFPARQYSPVQGRWLSPDPAGQSALHDRTPQSLNRYAYVLNSPLSQIDENGLDEEGGREPQLCDMDFCRDLGPGRPAPSECTYRVCSTGGTPPDPAMLNISKTVGDTKTKLLSDKCSEDFANISGEIYGLTGNSSVIGDLGVGTLEWLWANRKISDGDVDAGNGQTTGIYGFVQVILSHFDFSNSGVTAGKGVDFGNASLTQDQKDQLSRDWILIHELVHAMLSRYVGVASFPFNFAWDSFDIQNKLAKDCIGYGLK